MTDIAGDAAPRRVAWSGAGALIDDLVAAREARPGRWLLGITGPPGSGKSTMAHRVVARAEGRVTASVAPMDGFHRSNGELETMGLLELKGVPASFDAERFVDFLRLLRHSGAVPWPTFDRRLEETVPGGQPIGSDVELVVIEGNYLLLDSGPWSQVADLLDEVWYIHVPEETLIPRLRARHELVRTQEDAWAKVQSTDLPNAQLVAATRNRADVVIVEDADRSDRCT